MSSGGFPLSAISLLLDASSTHSSGNAVLYSMEAFTASIAGVIPALMAAAPPARRAAPPLPQRLCAGPPPWHDLQEVLGKNNVAPQGES